jgi:hypothetical protein
LETSIIVYRFYDDTSKCQDIRETVTSNLGNYIAYMNPNIFILSSPYLVVKKCFILKIYISWPISLDLKTTQGRKKMFEK